MTVGEGPLLDVEGHAGRGRSRPRIWSQTSSRNQPGAGGQPVGDAQRVGIAGEGGVVGRGRTGRRARPRGRVGGQVDPEGEAGVGVQPGDQDLEPGPDVRAGAGHRGPPHARGPEGALAPPARAGRGAAPHRGPATSAWSPRPASTPGRRRLEQRRPARSTGSASPVAGRRRPGPVRRDPLSATQSRDRPPLPPVPQQVDVDGGVRADRSARGRPGPRAPPRSPSRWARTVPLLLQGARPCRQRTRAARVTYTCRQRASATSAWPPSTAQTSTGGPAAVRGRTIRRRPRTPGRCRSGSRSARRRRSGGAASRAAASSSRAAALIGARCAVRLTAAMGKNGGMPRAIWSGSVSFGLVNVPVKLVTATSPKDVRFHQLHDADSGTDPPEAGVLARRRGGRLRPHRQGLRPGRRPVRGHRARGARRPSTPKRAGPSTSRSSSTWPTSTRSTSSTATTWCPTAGPRSPTPCWWRPWPDRQGGARPFRAADQAVPGHPARP